MYKSIFSKANNRTIHKMPVIGGNGEEKESKRRRGELSSREWLSRVCAGLVHWDILTLAISLMPKIVYPASNGSILPRPCVQASVCVMPD